MININNSNGIAATLCLQIFALIVTSIFAIYLSSIGESIFVIPSKTYLYAIFGGTILVTMSFSFYIFEEFLNYHKIFGTIFIILGIYLVVITNNN